MCNITFLLSCDDTYAAVSVTWCQQCYQWHQLLHQGNQKEMEHDYLVIWCQWHHHQHHVMPMTLPMAPLHLFNCSAMWLFWSCDAICTSVSTTWCQWHKKCTTIAFHRSIWLKWGLHDFFVMWCHWHWCHHCMMPMASSMVPTNCYF